MGSWKGKTGPKSAQDRMKSTKLHSSMYTIWALGGVTWAQWPWVAPLLTVTWDTGGFSFWIAPFGVWMISQWRSCASDNSNTLGSHLTWALPSQFHIQAPQELHAKNLKLLHSCGNIFLGSWYNCLSLEPECLKIDRRTSSTELMPVL